jgi:serine protease Do
VAGCVLAVLPGFAASLGADIPASFAERVKCVAAVQYTTDTGYERHSTIAMATAIDEKGTLILQPSSVDERIPVTQLKDFRVFIPGDGTGIAAEYLGQDSFTGWHFVRAGAEGRDRLKPVTSFVASAGLRTPRLAEEIWGIGLRSRDEDFLPYVMRGSVAMVTALPQKTAISQREVAAPGLPVFDPEGAFLGIAATSFGQSYLEIGGNGQARPITLLNIEESSAFLLAEEIVPFVERIPTHVSGRPIAWLGVMGMEPIDRSVAKFLQLGEQSGAVVGDVSEDSPAQTAGLRPRDMILAIDHIPVPALRPSRLIPAWINREVRRHRPGDVLALSVLRGSERLEIKVPLTDEPRLVREASRQSFGKFGFVVREFVHADAAARHLKSMGSAGVIVLYVKPGSSASAAGVREDDWIRRIDGADVSSFSESIEKLTAIENDAARPECLLQISRSGAEPVAVRIGLR